MISIQKEEPGLGLCSPVTDFRQHAGLSSSRPQSAYTETKAEHAGPVEALTLVCKGAAAMWLYPTPGKMYDAGIASGEPSPRSLQRMWPGQTRPRRPDSSESIQIQRKVPINTCGWSPRRKSTRKWAKAIFEKTNDQEFSKNIRQLILLY